MCSSFHSPSGQVEDNTKERIQRPLYTFFDNTKAEIKVKKKVHTLTNIDSSNIF